MKMPAAFFRDDSAGFVPSPHRVPQCHRILTNDKKRPFMESELWYLVLIPVLFAAGWWARGLDAGERERNSRRLPEAYSPCS